MAGSPEDWTTAGPAAPCYNFLIRHLVIGDDSEIAELLNPLPLLLSVTARSYIGLHIYAWFSGKFIL